MRNRNKVRVWKHAIGVWVWDCQNESCHAPNDSFRHGASVHWEIANLQAREHANEWHKRERHVPRDMSTPPGGTRFDWSESGMHVTIPNPRGEA